MKPADIILVRGTGALSDAIARMTHSHVSHAAMLVGVNPHIVIEAITPRVTVRPLDVCLKDASAAYWLHRADGAIDEQREAIVGYALRFCDDLYGSLDLALQALDIVARSVVFTDILGAQVLKHWPICSYIPATSYEANGEPLVGIPSQDVTPANLYDAPSSDKRLAIEQIKGS